MFVRTQPYACAPPRRAMAALEPETLQGNTMKEAANGST